MQEFLEKNVTIAQLAKLLSFDTSKKQIRDTDDLELDVETPTGFKHVSSFVVKERTQAWQLGDLLASGEHRVLYNGSWEHVKNIPIAKPLEQKIDVVDLEVPDGECYIANGWVNHNTTPGGWN